MKGHGEILYEWATDRQTYQMVYGHGYLICCLGLLGLVIHTAQSKVKEIRSPAKSWVQVYSISSGYWQGDFTWIVVARLSIIIATPHRVSFGQYLGCINLRTEQKSHNGFPAGGLILMTVTLITLSFKSYRPIRPSHWGPNRYPGIHEALVSCFGVLFYLIKDGSRICLGPLLILRGISKRYRLSIFHSLSFKTWHIDSPSQHFLHSLDSVTPTEQVYSKVDPAIPKEHKDRRTLSKKSIGGLALPVASYFQWKKKNWNTLL